MSLIEKRIKDSDVLAFVCNQFGDTSKGKFTDLFADDINIRGTGGANAGHTIMINGVKYVFNLLPSGILHDSDGKINIVGSGVAFDPNIVRRELKVLESHGKSFDNLMIAYNSKLVLPQHVLLDNLLSKKKIGTTGKGIGPLYQDFIGRRRVITNDLLNHDLFCYNLRDSLNYAIKLAKSFDSDDVKTIMNSPALKDGLFYSNEKSIFNIDAIVEHYMDQGKFFKDMIRDTDSFAVKNLGKKKILLEGAQGLLLSSEYGASPFITCSDSSFIGLAQGAGLTPRDVDLVLGIAKFYMTRVGEGPFVTELGGNHSDYWCNQVGSRVLEEEAYSSTPINSLDDFEKGVAIRRIGNEYGATTGRPRRIGWLDLPALRYATRVNGPDLIFTKADVLTGIDEIKIATSYTYEGPDFVLGDKVLKEGDTYTDHIPLANVMKNSRANYVSFSGWDGDISNIRKFEDLPENLKNIFKFVERETNSSVRIVSVGPDRHETIYR